MQWRLLCARLQHSNDPILVGPFRGEVGFEALYWLPWLRKVRKDLNLAPERLIAVTRSGSALWYDMGRAFEMFDIRTPQQVRVENRMQGQRTGLIKQMRITPFDAGVIHDVADRLELKRYHVLHPHWMYHALCPYWEGYRGFEWLIRRVEYRVPMIDTVPSIPNLPPRFVAVKFYERATLPGTPDVTAFAKSVVHSLAANIPVVLLNTGQHVDDHRDLDVTGPNITRLCDYVDIQPQNTLVWQTALMAQSVGVTGTYGGLMQMAALLGKPTVSFYAEWGATAIAHKNLSGELALRTGVPFLVHRIGDVPLLQSVLPLITTTNSMPVASVTTPS